MKNKISYYSLIYFFKQIITLAVPLLTVPYVSRVLSVEGIGIANYINSIISYFILISMFGINVYGVRELSKLKNDIEKRNRMISKLCSINLLILIIVYLIIFIISISITSFNNLLLPLWVGAIQIIFYTFSWEWILVSFEDFNFLTITSIASYFFTMLLTFLLIRNTEDVIEYIVITYIGNVITSILSYLYIRKKYNIKLKFIRPSFKLIREILPLFTNTLFQSVYVHIDTLMIGIMLDSYNVGLYTSSVKLYTIVKTVFSTPVSVSISRCSNLFSTNKKEYNCVINDILSFLVVFVFPACLFISFNSDEIIWIIYTNKFMGANISLKVLSFSAIFSILNIFINSLVLIPQNKETLLLKLSGLSAVLNFTLNIFIIRKFGIAGAAITTLLSEIVILVFSLRYLIPSLRIDEFKKNIYHSILGVILIILVRCGLNLLNISVVYSLILMFLIWFILYTSCLLLVHNESIEKFKQKIQQFFDR